MATYLYHICRRCDKGNLSEGYIGISVDCKRRWSKHRSQPNGHLKCAMEKYDDIVYDIITEGYEEEMLRMEQWLRPQKNIGWNIAEGGGKPPSWAGKNHTESTKIKVSELRSGRGNGGWTGFWKTPRGIFKTAKEVGEYFGFTPSTARNRNNSKAFPGWSLIPKDMLISIKEIS